MVVGVGIETDVISVPGDTGPGVSCHSTSHVALIGLRTGVHFQWDGECWRCLKATVLGEGYSYGEFFCGD